ncbi:hypothetical protein V1264_013252 [Littorina saxatilis]|uniref:LolA-like domain-containing protein n=1 Tax=Littorina saxatilis TaxID=31220 RepID=A0AAN9BQ34_9CAEN
MVPRHPEVVVWHMVVLTVVAVAGQRMANVCNDVPDDIDHSNKRPQIGNQFHVHVECQLSEQNQTAFVHEFYDMTRNRGRLTVQKPFGTNDYFMDYDQNLLLMVDPDTSKCKTGILLLSEDKFVFGFKMAGFNSQMYSPSGALHFSNANESYNGTSDVRGIVVDEWHSCQYLPSINATAHVVWYFSQKANWDMQVGMVTTPIRMTAVGKQVLPDNSVKPFSHVYDFFDFTQTVNLTDLEVPNGIYCPERSLLAPPKPFPTVPDSFFFVGEINDPFGVQFTYMEEAYDNDTKYSMYNFKMDVTDLTGINQYTELNDYNTGVGYMIDNSAGSCNLGPLTSGAMAFTKQVNGQQIRMKTPREFFMDKTVHYQYAGTQDARGIPCDRWVGVTNTAQGYEGQNVTLEWYFAAEDHESWNDYATATKYRLPVRFNLFLHGDVASQSYEFNIFYFNTKYYMHEVDISQCYKGTQRKTLRFSISLSNESIVRQNTLQMKQAIQNAVSLNTGISPMRIDNVEVSDAKHRPSRAN